MARLGLVGLVGLGCVPLVGCSMLTGGDSFDGTAVLRVAVFPPAFSDVAKPEPAWDSASEGAKADPDIKGSIAGQPVAHTAEDTSFAETKIEGIDAALEKLAVSVTVSDQDGSVSTAVGKLEGDCAPADFPCVFMDGAAYAEVAGADAAQEPQANFTTRANAAFLEAKLDLVPKLCAEPSARCAGVLAAYTGTSHKDAALDAAGKALQAWSDAGLSEIETACLSGDLTCGAELADTLGAVAVLATNRALAKRFDAKVTAQLMLEGGARALASACEGGSETCGPAAAVFVQAITEIRGDLAAAGVDVDRGLDTVRAAAAPSLIAELGNVVPVGQKLAFAAGEVKVVLARKADNIKNIKPGPQFEHPEVVAEGYFVLVEAILRNTSGDTQSWTKIAVPTGVTMDLVDPFGMELQPDGTAMRFTEHNLGGDNEGESVAFDVRSGMSQAVGWGFDLPKSAPSANLYLRFTEPAAEEEGDGEAAAAAGGAEGEAGGEEAEGPPATVYLVELF